MTEPAQDAEPDDEPEAVTPEVVQPDPAPAFAEASAARSALERAAELALTQPDVPGRDEFLALAATSRILSMSAGAPKLVQGNPYLAFHLALVGRDLNISPSAALAQIDVIDTKKGPQLSLSPELMNGQIRRLGLGRIVPAVKASDRCVAVALRPDGNLDHRCARSWPEHVDDCECSGVLGESEFTWADAQMAGLAGRQCRPGEHKILTGKDYCPCNQGYRSYPRRMMWWRAAGFCADDYFPEASLGLYSSEELGAVVDVDGRPVDPATVVLPEGYEPKPLPPGPGDLPAEAEKVAALKATIARFGPEAKAELRALWTNVDAEGYEVREGAEPLPPVDHLLGRHYARARGMVGTIEAKCKRGLLPWAEGVAGDAQEPPKKPETTDESAEPSQAAESAPTAVSGDDGEDEEDRRAAEVQQAVHDRVWEMKLADVRAELTALGIDSTGKPDEVRDRLATERARLELAGIAEQVPVSGSLMDAYADRPEG